MTFIAPKYTPIWVEDKTVLNPHTGMVDHVATRRRHNAMQRAAMRDYYAQWYLETFNEYPPDDDVLWRTVARGQANRCRAESEARQAS